MKLVYTVAWGRSRDDGSSSNVTAVDVEDNPAQAEDLFRYYREEWRRDSDPLNIGQRTKEVFDEGPNRFTYSVSEYCKYSQEWRIETGTFELVEG